MKHLFALLALCLALSGCATPVERERHGREIRYNQLLAQLKPGATRADLQRLFPGVTTPRPFATAMPTIFTYPPGPDFSERPEFYSLDAEFRVAVRYHYQRIETLPAKPARPVAPERSQRLGKPGVSPNAIDALLFGDHGPKFKIYPQSDDRIAALPLVVQDVRPRRESGDGEGPPPPPNFLR